MLLTMASAPSAVLAPPVVSVKSTKASLAVLLTPLLRLERALVPSAVLLPGDPPSGAGVTARAVGESANDARAMAGAMRRKPRCKGDRLIEFLKCRVVIFFV